MRDPGALPYFATLVAYAVSGMVFRFSLEQGIFIVTHKQNIQVH